MVAKLYSAKYPTAFFKIVMQKMPMQIYERARDAPTSSTNESKYALHFSMPLPGGISIEEMGSCPDWKRIRKNGTTLKNVNKERKAFKTLHTTFTTKFNW
tara:strand:+ start:831 stop:1130 length:300 start_codon:yes stop_codon:yes gene_type:complete